MNIITEPETVFKLAPNITTQKIEDQLFITISKNSENYHAEKAIYILNPTGCAIWKYIDGKANIMQIIERLSDDYSASIERIEKDVLSMMSEFLKKELILAN